MTLSVLRLLLISSLVCFTVWKESRWIQQLFESSPTVRSSHMAQQRPSQEILQPSIKIKPTFYLHVGLHKTGTTFLQLELCRHFRLLARDNLIYLGTCYGAHKGNFFVNHELHSIFQHAITTSDCYISMTANRTLSKQTDVFSSLPRFNPRSNFVAGIQELRKRNYNVLFVYEVLSCFTDDMIERLKNILTPTWNVKVLVVHRNFHDWLLSFHDEIHKLPKKEHSSWRKKVLPFNPDDELMDSSQILTSVERHSLHPALLVWSKYKKHFEDVQLVSLNELKGHQPRYFKGDSLMEYILCTFIKDANVSCQEEQNGALSQLDLQANARMDRSIDLIAQEAYEQQLIPRLIRRQVASRAVEQIVTSLASRNNTTGQMNFSFPLSCPSDDQLQRLERVSIAADQQILNWTASSQEAHHASFRKLVDAHHFCHVDAKLLLQNNSLRALLMLQHWNTTSMLPTQLEQDISLRPSSRHKIAQARLAAKRRQIDSFQNNGHFDLSQNEGPLNSFQNKDQFDSSQNKDPFNSFQARRSSNSFRAFKASQNKGQFDSSQNKDPFNSFQNGGSFNSFQNRDPF